MQSSSNSERNSFLLFAQKRNHYLNCLVDILNFLDSHSDYLKFRKMNNQKGLKTLINGFIQNIDKFVEEGSELELILENQKK